MTDQGMPAGAFPPPMPGAPEPEPKRAIKPWMWWAGGGGLAFVALAVVAGVVGVNLVAGAGGGAKATAQQYLDAIAKGDAAAASTLARVDTKDEDNVLLAGQALSKAKHITAVSVGKVVTSSRSDRAVVDVRYKLDGKSYRDSIEVDRDDEGWFVTEGMAYDLPYAPYQTGYKLAGSDQVVASEDDALVAYPGVYTLEAPNDYFTLTGDKTMAVTAEYGELDIELTPSSSYLEEAQKQLDAHFDACAAKTSYYDLEDCGIDLDYPDQILSTKATVAVTIVDYPKVSTEKDGLALSGGSFTAKASGPTYGGSQATEDVTAELGYVNFGVKFTKGKLVVTVD